MKPKPVKSKPAKSKARKSAAKDVQYAWAVHTRSDEAYGFLGRYWCFPDDKAYPENSVMLVRLFETRRNAKSALAEEKAKRFQAFPDAAVCRVRVTVEEVPR